MASARHDWPRRLRGVTPRPTRTEWRSDLAALSDPRLVAPRLAACLGLRDVPYEVLGRTLVSVLNTKRLLLVLDNCEHLVAMCDELATHERWRVSAAHNLRTEIAASTDDWCFRPA